jgi:hypothetical protein
MKPLIAPLFLGVSLAGSVATAWIAQGSPATCAPPRAQAPEPEDARIIEAFGKQGIRINAAEAQGIRPNVRLALQEAQARGLGNSKVDFAAVEMARDLGLDAGPGSGTVRNIVAAIGYLERDGASCWPPPRPLPPPAPPIPWRDYFRDTTNLWNQPEFMGLMNRYQFHPVKISWEDIGRSANSVWGDRISDVGIWVREDERDPGSARLALSVRRDSNFRDKVLMVPAERIKVHVKQGDRTVEKTLPQRLKELGLASAARDRNVIVSNQFAIVPVPSRTMRGAWPEGVPPRAAFTFSIFPYGSTNFVITDVIEGSSEAIVGPGSHQLLFGNVHGQKAPFTASRAEDRPDLLRMEKELKAQGMDVDVQRYYLIQVPLRRGVPGLRLSNLGEPPMARAFDLSTLPVGNACADVVCLAPGAASCKAESIAQKCAEAPGLDKVAIGHGEAEGPYYMGSGYAGARAEEPIRVTVVYFVTPVGKVSARDLERFAQAFRQWDAQAIWGGSFVTKEN